MLRTGALNPQVAFDCPAGTRRSGRDHRRSGGRQSDRHESGAQPSHAAATHRVDLEESSESWNVQAHSIPTIAVGNRYPVPPELAAAKAEVRQRLGADTIDIATSSGMVVARHRVAQPALGVTIRAVNIAALEAIAIAAAPPGRPHRRRERIPPGVAALRRQLRPRIAMATWIERT